MTYYKLNQDELAQKYFDKYTSLQSATPSLENIRKVVYNGIMFLNYDEDAVFNAIDAHMELHPEIDRLEFVFNLHDDIRKYIGILTPRQMTQIFPLTKSYEKPNSGWKDYLSSSRSMAKRGWDKPIGDVRAVFDFEWDYWNWEVTNFTISAISIVDHYRKRQGKESVMVEFMKSQGVEPIYLNPDELE